jgi:hypothetical protein
MRIQCYKRDIPLIARFLNMWLPDKSGLVAKNNISGLSISWLCFGLSSTDEAEPLYLDVDAAELANCFDSLTKKGFVQSAKALIIGDHFYRSDTGKCPRCWRYRPEIHWNNENLKDCNAELCDRCMDAAPSCDAAA